MRLTAPVHRLKHRAKRLARQHDIPLHTALDRIAASEGFGSWSLLAARLAAAGGDLPAASAPVAAASHRPAPDASSPDASPGASPDASPGASMLAAKRLFARLAPGDMVLVGARPRQGKTLLGLQLALEAIAAGGHGAFFTLEWTEAQTLARLAALGVDPARWPDRFGGRFHFDGADTISADHIAAALAEAPRGTVAVVDYLQLLDQRRDNPDLMTQVRALAAFARARGVIFVFIAQIDRAFDPAAKPCPDLADVRLPNPVDLRLFGKTCFLHAGEIRFAAAA